MITTIVSGGLKAVVWGLAAAGFALVLAGLVAWPVRQPPELTSISGSRKSVDLSSLPAIERFQARDGTVLGFRHYPATGSTSGRAAILIHGSSGSSGTTIHALSGALAAHGVETYTVDIRGHGASGTCGDVAYVGQLEDDLADFVAVVRKTTPTAPLTLIGHSSGGGFALRVAASPIQNLFARTVLLAPYLGSTRTRIRTFDARMLFAFLLFIAFGIFCCRLGHFTPRQLGTLWPIYFMLVYTIAGLWVGHAFVAIGLCISALTLIGYFFVGDAFDLWMAFVNGSGLMLGGLWMRRS
jgi:pimeloyl-ACP methyl ester carboxylesterase